MGGRSVHVREFMQYQELPDDMQTRIRDFYEHCWRPGDLLIWDNLTIQHARPEPNDVPRTLRRFHIANSDLTADYIRVARERGYM